MVNQSEIIAGIWVRFLMGQRQLESDGFVLHRRNYGETSKILSLFTQGYGRVDILCKGCRNPGRKNRILEPFRRYRLCWSGRSGLKILRQYDEVTIYSLFSRQERLYCGLYLNELLNSIIRIDEVESNLFSLYDITLAELASCDKEDIVPLLRLFELNLIRLMGYGINLDVESDGGTPIEESMTYAFEAEQGFYRSHTGQNILIHGDTLTALSSGQFKSKRQLKEAKQFTRILINYYFPNCSIQSRKLFS